MTIPSSLGWYLVDSTDLQFFQHIILHWKHVRTFKYFNNQIFVSFFLIFSTYVERKKWCTLKETVKQWCASFQRFRDEQESFAHILFNLRATWGKRLQPDIRYTYRLFMVCTLGAYYSSTIRWMCSSWEIEISENWISARYNDIMYFRC